MDKENENKMIGLNGQNNQVIKADIGLLFSGDSYGLFVFKKTERIVTAIYLLTGLMSDKEPMKERLRNLATEMLMNAIEMSERIWGEENFQKNLISSICEASALFDVAETTKMMSKMNHKIISNELKNLSDFLITSSSNYSSAKIAFEPNMFDGDYNYVPDQKNNSFNQSMFNTQVSEEKAFYKGQDTIKDNQKNSVFDKMSDKKQKTEKKSIKDKGNRQDIIQSMLKTGLKLTIKDFSKNIKDCSEKTIQRELIDMVSKGLLKKEGERRWSKYFLA